MLKFHVKSLLIFVCFLALIGGYALPVGAQTFSSSSRHSVTDPLVVIVVDVTSQSEPCIETLKANINTSYASTTQFPCPAGTILSTKQVPLSQALAQHEPYVPLSSRRPSTTLDKQIQRQIEQLMKSKRSHLLQFLSKNGSVHPTSTACGNNGSGSVSWTATDHDVYMKLTSTEQFYILPSPNCSEANLDTASISVGSIYDPYYPSNQTFAWNHDQYSSGWFGIPFGGYLSPYHNYSHSVNQIWPKGLYYETWMHDYVYYHDQWCNILVN